MRPDRDLLQPVTRSRVVRAAMRYITAHGSVYAGGVTLSALISLVAALTIAVTALRVAIGQRPGVLPRVVDVVNETFPGLLRDGDQPGVLAISELTLDGGLTLTSLVSLPVLVWTSVSAMTYLRLSIRAMFGLSSVPLHPGRAKLWDLVGIGLLGTSVVLTAILSSLATSTARFLLEHAHVERGDELALRGAVLLTVLLVDALTIGVLVRTAAKVRVPWSQRWRGALLGALGWGVLRVAGTGAIAAVDNPLLASFAGLVTLILWINLAVRWLLFSAAWTADPPMPGLVDQEEAHAREVPNYVTLTAPHTLAWPHHRVTGALVGDQDPVDERTTRPRRG